MTMTNDAYYAGKIAASDLLFKGASALTETAKVAGLGNAAIGAGVGSVLGAGTGAYFAPEGHTGRNALLGGALGAGAGALGGFGGGKLTEMLEQQRSEGFEHAAQKTQQGLEQSRVANRERAARELQQKLEQSRVANRERAAREFQQGLERLKQQELQAAAQQGVKGASIGSRLGLATVGAGLGAVGGGVTGGVLGSLSGSITADPGHTWEGAVEGGKAGLGTGALLGAAVLGGHGLVPELASIPGLGLLENAMLVGGPLGAGYKAVEKKNDHRKSASVLGNVAVGSLVGAGVGAGTGALIAGEGNKARGATSLGVIGAGMGALSGLGTSAAQGLRKALGGEPEQVERFIQKMVEQAEAEAAGNVPHPVPGL